MSSKSISVRIQPNSGRKAAGQRKHDLRDPSATPDYVDPSRSAANSVIIESPKPEAVRAEIAANRLASGQKKLQADARTTIAGIITFGKDAQPIIETLSKTAQDEIFERVAQRVAREASRPLLGLVVHRDESAIHAHFSLRGYELKDGREIAPRFTPANLKRLQDVIAMEVAHLGIERGTPKNIRIGRGESKAQTVHRTVAELHNDLPQERAALALEVAELTTKRDNYARLTDKAREQLKADSADAERLEKRIATYEARIAKLDESTKKYAAAPLKPVEPMKRLTVELVKGRKLLGRVESGAYEVVDAKDAARYEAARDAREAGLLKTLDDPLVQIALAQMAGRNKTHELEMREMRELVGSIKSKASSRNYGLGD